MDDPRTETDKQLASAIALATKVLTSPACFAPERSVAVDLAHAVMVLGGMYHLTPGGARDAILPGDLIRLSVQLVHALDQMPGQESVTVQYVRAERGADGVNVLMLRQAEQVAH